MLKALIPGGQLLCLHGQMKEHSVLCCSFAEGSELSTGRYGFDRVRNTVIGKTDIKLTYFQEVFTSDHWMVRIYKVKDPPNRGFKRKNPKRRRSLAKAA